MAMNSVWDNAPVWAKYRACDRDGKWYWFEAKPEKELENKIWASSVAGSRVERCYLINENWETSLEGRPSN